MYSYLRKENLVKLSILYPLSKLVNTFQSLGNCTIFCLGAWLSEESMAMREEVCEILPFILTLSNQTFESQKLTKVFRHCEMENCVKRGQICIFAEFTRKFLYFWPTFSERLLSICVFFFSVCLSIYFICIYPSNV